jgi:rhomboid protease GluP
MVFNKSSDEQEVAVISDDMLAETEERINFEKDMSYFPLISLWLIALNVIVFIWEINTNALLDQERIIAAGALHRDSVLAGEWWRLFSAMFLHGSVDHLVGNCVVLYILGIACEHAFKVRRTLVIYLFAGVSGALLSLTFQPGPSVGASGAIFGVMGSVIAFLYRYRKQFILRDNRIAFVLLIWAVYQILSGLMTPYIDNFAHLGGFIGGVVVTLLLQSPLLQQSQSLYWR